MGKDLKVRTVGEVGGGEVGVGVVEGWSSKESIENASCGGKGGSSETLEATDSERGCDCGMRIKSSSWSNSVAVHTISSSSEEEDSSMASKRSSEEGGEVSIEKEEPEWLQVGEYTLSQWVKAIAGNDGSIGSAKNTEKGRYTGEARPKLSRSVSAGVGTTTHVSIILTST